LAVCQNGVTMEYNKDLTLRLKKVEGQLHGVLKMLEDRRNCVDIIQQLQAAQSAISSTNQLIIRQYLSQCLKEGINNSDLEKINELSKLFSLLEIKE
jgi:DNA-binding FrmR family transcriptional regulator